MIFTIYTATCTGRKQNTRYPNKVEVEKPRQLQECAQFDHVCATYKNNHRSEEDYMFSDVLPMDIDNDKTDDPDEIITVEKLDEMFSDINYVLVPSRHHMLPKEGKPAAPRYHVYFPISRCTEAEVYAGLKVQLQKKYPFFDDNALDAGRFLFGSDVDEDAIIWHDGWLNIDDELDINYRYKKNGNFEKIEDPEPAPYTGTIPEGQRNSHMSQFAARILKRYGYTEKARTVFLERAEKCDPPLPDEELTTIWNSAVRFFKNKISQADGYVDAEEYDDDFKAESLKPEDFSDIGEAKILAREFGDELKYSDATGYIRYDTTVWVESDTVATSAMVDFLDLQLDDATQEKFDKQDALIEAKVPEAIARSGSKSVAKYFKDIDTDTAKLPLLEDLISAEQYVSFVMKNRDSRKIAAVTTVARAFLGVAVSDLDKDPFLLNTKTGTYDLRKGLDGFREHAAEDLITKITTCGPDQEGHEIWEDALNTFFCNDPELIEYVQLVAGMAAIGTINQEHLIIAYGSGANGKSTFWNSIYRVMGDYAGKISADALTTSCKRNVKPEMAELKGKRLIIASEMDEGMRLNTGVVKQLCATDEIYAEKKYKAPFAFKPSHTLVLYTNHLPRVGANDDGIWRRLIVIPFNATITGDGDIKNYADFLVENAGGAILAWILEGAKKVIARDYHTPFPKVVQAAIDTYRENNDWMQHFLDECCDVEDGLSERSGELYRKYREYCAQSGEYPRSTTDFYSEIEKRGFTKKKTKTGALIYGVKLKDFQEFLE